MLLLGYSDLLFYAQNTNYIFTFVNYISIYFFMSVLMCSTVVLCYFGCLLAIVHLRGLALPLSPIIPRAPVTGGYVKADKIISF